MRKLAHWRDASNALITRGTPGGCLPAPARTAQRQALRARSHHTAGRSGSCSQTVSPRCTGPAHQALGPPPAPVTCAAIKRVLQLSVSQDAEVVKNHGKIVSVAIKQILENKIEYKLEE